MAGCCTRASRRVSYGLLVLALAAASTGVQAQRAVLRVAAADTTTRHVDPGSVASVAFIVANPTSDTITAEPRLELPAGWHLVMAGRTLTLAPGASELHLVGVRIAPDAPAGRYEVALTLAARARAAVSMVVRERRRLELTPGRAPAYIPAGESFTSLFTAVNRGNAEMRVRLLSRAGSGLVVEHDSLMLRLAPGGSRDVVLRVHTDAADLPMGGKRYVSLRIEAAAPGADTAVWAAASQVVTVLPPATEAGDLMHRVPTQLRLRSVGTNGNAAFDGVAWAGSGALVDGGATRVDFLANWSRWGVSPFGERDEYRLTLTRPGAELRVGDQVYGLSPLTDPGRVASGAGMSLARGPWSAGGYISDDRWALRDARQERGAYLALEPDPGVRASLQYLTVSGPGAGSVWSTRALVAPSPFAHLDAELGFGHGERDGGAWMLDLTGAPRWLSYRVRLLHGDSTYPGVTAGRDEQSLRVSLAPWGPLRLATWSDRRAMVPTAARPLLAERYVTAGVSLGVADWLDLEYRRDELRSRFWSISNDARDEALRLRVTGRRDRLRFSGSVEAGQVTDRARSVTSPFGRYVLDATLTPWDGYAVSAFVDHRTGRTLHTASNRSVTTTGITATMAPSATTSVTLSASTELAAQPELPWLRQPGRLELFASHVLPLAHRLSARLRVTTSGIPGLAAQSVAQLDYAIPVGAPVGHRRDLGRFTVVVTDAETGRGMPGVLLRLGTMTLVTDDEGRVAPVAVPSGVHGLRLERTGAWLDRVAVTELPATVTIVEGRTSRVEVALVRGARVTGHVRRFVAIGSSRDDAPARELVDSAGVERMAVTLTRGDEVLHTLTDADGGFRYEALPPGRWTLHVAGDLPPFHELERSTVQVELAPGGAVEVAFAVLPRERTLRMVAQAELRAMPASDASQAEPAVVPVSAPRHHITTARERTLEEVARQMYGDATRWPKLWLANRDIVSDPWALQAGITLVVPPDGPLTPEERAAAARFRKRFPPGKNR